MTKITFCDLCKKDTYSELDKSVINSNINNIKILHTAFMCVCKECKTDKYDEVLEEVNRLILKDLEDVVQTINE